MSEHEKAAIRAAMLDIVGSPASEREAKIEAAKILLELTRSK